MNGKKRVLLLLFLAPFAASAQFSGVGEPLQMTLEPERPAPHDTVEITLQSFMTDLSTAEIVWVVNDRVVSSGNERRMSVNAGPAGGSVKVIVRVRAADGATYSKELRLRPAEVTLLWQSEGYAPPFYRGKALAPFEGRVTVVALPLFTRENGAVVNPQELIYSWSENDEPVAELSGVGKNSFVFRGRVPIRPVDVSVVVTSKDKTLVAEARDSLYTEPPALLFYENHPRYGIRFNRAVRSRVILEEDELKLSAVPFFFETETRDGGTVRYEWALNFVTRPMEAASSITLRRDTDAGGESAVSLTAQEAEHLFQAGRAETTVTFPQRRRVSPAPTSSESP
jgi:hypothetical protein